MGSELHLSTPGLDTAACCLASSSLTAYQREAEPRRLYERRFLEKSQVPLQCCSNVYYEFRNWSVAGIASFCVRVVEGAIQFLEM